jgi:hypothetical protein
MAVSRQPVNKLFGADVRRLLNLLLLKSRLKVGSFPRVGNHGPRLRLHCLRLALMAAGQLASIRTTFSTTANLLSSMAGFHLGHCSEVTSPSDYW